MSQNVFVSTAANERITFAPNGSSVEGWSVELIQGGDYVRIANVESVRPYTFDLQPIQAQGGFTPGGALPDPVGRGRVKWDPALGPQEDSISFEFGIYVYDRATDYVFHQESLPAAEAAPAE